MSEVVSVEDVKQIAKKKISNFHWIFLSGAGEDEYTMRDNEDAFKRYRLRPLVLNDVSEMDISTAVLGHHVKFPICATPFNMRIGVELIGCDGSEAVARGASAVGTVYAMSNWASSSIEEIATAAPNIPKFFQVYIYKNRKLTENLIRRAESIGFHGLIVTVDNQIPGHRSKHLLRNLPFNDFHCRGLFGELMTSYPDGDYGDPSVTWSDIKWVQSLTKLPIVLKGILTGEMARKAVDFGVAGITVSNHGGRHLDGTPATIDALPEVVRAVEGRCEVYIDGGIRTGTDVLKALALGARAVFVGRPLAWGAVWKGPEGVQKVFEILRDELKTAMQLMGCRSIKDLQETKNLVVPQSFYQAKL